MITIDGLVSGIDTETILNGLMQLQQTRIDRLKLQKSDIQKKQVAFQSVEAAVVSLRSSIAKLARSQNNVFSSSTVSVSNETVLSATASANASRGVYQISVESIAQAHQIASQTFTSAEAAITHGTLELRSGNGPVTTITVDSTNDTLQGLAEAIQNSGSGLSASIVQDGTGSRLLLSAQKTGTANAIQLTNNLAASSGGATAVSFNTGTPVQAATDSVVKLGSGAGAITATSANSQIEGLLPGVKLDLLKAAPGESITIQVAPETIGAVTAVEEFVNAYNTLIKGIKEQTKFVPETNAAGLLLGESSVIEVQRTIQAALQESVAGVNGQLNRLSAVGISFNDDGTLSLNSSRLTNVLNGNVSGVTSRDVQKLFGLAGESSHAGITYILGSSRTRPSNTPYQVDISRAPEQAQLTSGTALAASTVIDNTNDALSLTLDGEQIEINLQHGTYAAADLMAEVLDTVNAHPDVGSRRVTGELHSDLTWTLSSESYGRSSELHVHSGSALTALGFTAGVSDRGVDVAGQFIVNGQAEAASGSGRILTGVSSNTNTADLQVRVTLGSADVTTGVEGTLTVTQGIASRLDNVLGNLLDVDSGRLGITNRGFSERAENIQKTIDKQQDRFESQRDRLLKELIGLETAISKIQGTSSLLGSQLASLSGSRSN